MRHKPYYPRIKKVRWLDKVWTLLDYQYEIPAQLAPQWQSWLPVGVACLWLVKIFVLPLSLSFRPCDQFTAAVRTDRIHFFCAAGAKCALVAAYKYVAAGVETDASFLTNWTHFQGHLNSSTYSRRQHRSTVYYGKTR